MKKISMRVRNFDQERFLTYNIDNDATLDEDMLDFLEEDEPKGIVPIIFEEGEECDTFSYDITEKIHLSELSEQEVNAEMVLKILHSLLLALIDMSEFRIPLAYLVLNRNYIYVDSDYQIEFICIPLEEMKEDVDVNAFLKGFLSNIRYDLTENCNYVAQLLTYLNNSAMFNTRNMVSLVEDLMEDMGVEILQEDFAEIYADYQEVLDEAEEMEMNEEPAFEEETEEAVEEDFEEEMEEEEAEENAEEAEGFDFGDVEELIEEEEEVEEEPMAEAIGDIDDILSAEEAVTEEAALEEVEIPSEEKAAKKTGFKTKEASVTGVVIEDDLDEFLAEKEREDHIAQFEENGLKIKKNIKVNRASVVKSSYDEEETKEEVTENVEEDDEAVSTSILSQNMATTGILNNPTLPKANPYLIRTNTEERVMITKQTFKIGKASVGVDYTIRGNGAISRSHAIIMNKDDVFYIKDNKSTNHTYVNNKMVQEGQMELLTHDCKIVLGDEEFTFKLR